MPVDELRDFWLQPLRKPTAHNDDPAFGKSVKAVFGQFLADGIANDPVTVFEKRQGSREVTQLYTNLFHLRFDITTLISDLLQGSFG